MTQQCGVIWEHFTPEVNWGKNSAKCNLCKKLLQLNDHKISQMPIQEIFKTLKRKKHPKSKRQIRLMNSWN